MAFTIIVRPKMNGAVPQGKTFFFFGYKNGAIQTTDRPIRAAVIAETDIERLLVGLAEKADTCLFEKRASDRQVNWTLQRLRTPKAEKVTARRQGRRHYPKIKSMRPRELTARYAEFCAH